jgi:hypothetical protein
MYPNNIKRSLLAQFSATNHYTRPLTEADVTFGNPELFLQGSCNTRVTITSKPGNGWFKGIVTLHYNRRRLDRYLTGLKVPGKREDYTTVHEVVEALAEAYYLPLLKSDFINSQLGVSTVSVTIQAIPQAFGWINTWTATLPFAE